MTSTFHIESAARKILLLALTDDVLLHGASGAGGTALLKTIAELAEPEDGVCYYPTVTESGRPRPAPRDNAKVWLLDDFGIGHAAGVPIDLLVGRKVAFTGRKFESFAREDWTRAFGSPPRHIFDIQGFDAVIHTDLGVPA